MEAMWWGVQLSDSEQILCCGLGGEAEAYSSLTAVGQEWLKITLINSAVVMLQQSNLRGTCNTGEHLITSCCFKYQQLTGASDALQHMKDIHYLSLKKRGRSCSQGPKTWIFKWIIQYRWFNADAGMLTTHNQVQHIQFNIA